MARGSGAPTNRSAAPASAGHKNGQVPASGTPFAASPHLPVINILLVDEMDALGSGDTSSERQVIFACTHAWFDRAS